MMDVTEANFERDVLRASDRLPVLVEFWAPWSASSKALGPLLERLERDFAGAFALVRVDVEENPELIRRLGVKSVPFSLLFADGEPVDGFVGAPAADYLEAFVGRHVTQPTLSLAGRAREALDDARFSEAAEGLGMLLAINPANQTVRADFVRTLVRMGQFDRALRAFEPLRGRARTDYAVDVLAHLLEAVELARRFPDEAALLASLGGAGGEAGATGEAGEGEADDGGADAFSARYALAQWLMVNGRLGEAMDHFLAILGQDRLYREGAARKSMLAALDLDRDSERVATYRRRLAAALFN